MNRAWVVVGAVCLWGCSGDFRQDCYPNQTCNEGLTCAQGICLRDANPDGGGGVAEFVGCAMGCEDWETCRPAMDAGVCELLTLTIQRPTNLESFDAGAVVRVVARATQWDGGGFSASTLPVVVSMGVGGPVTLASMDGGVYAADFTLPASAGYFTFTVGWMDLSEQVVVQSLKCERSCRPWEACMAGVDGGSCADPKLELVWVEPAPLQTFAADVDATVHVILVSDAGLPLPTGIPATLVNVGTGTTLVSGPGGYTGILNVGDFDGTYAVRVGWWTVDGGPYWERNIKVDATPPQLALLVPSDGGAYQRDAVVNAVLASNEPLADAGVTLAGVPMARVADRECGNFNDVPDAAMCFALDFSKPALNALDGGFLAQMTGIDLFENRSVARDGGLLAVTRVRWAIDAGSAPVQSMAVGSDGTLYVGTSTSSGSLFAFGPDGGTVGTNVIGEVQSLAVGPAATGGYVYLAYNPSGIGTVGSIRALNPVSLVTTSLRAPCEGTTASSTHAGIALFVNNAETLAVGSINSVIGLDGNGCVYRPTSGSSVVFGSGSQFDSATVPTRTEVASNVVVSGQNAYFLRQTGAGASWQPIILNGTSAPTTNISETSLGSDPTSYGAGQLVTDGGIIVGGAGFSTRSVYRLHDAGVLESNALGGATADKGTPVAASGLEGYVGMGDSLMRFNPQSLASTPTSVVSMTGDSIRTSPVLGAARATDGIAEGYVVSRAGQLATFRHSAAMSSLSWRAPLGGQVVAHPAFDCNRARLGGETGILYIGTTNGRVLSIIVDSPKLLEAPGAWPKYQRSMGNAGNDDLANFPTNWPGCP